MATPEPIDDIPTYGEQVPFLPKELYKAKLKVLKIFYHVGHKGKAYLAYVEPVTCTTNALRIGSRYCLRFPRDMDQTKDQARMTEFKRFIAASSGSKTLDGFSSDAAIATYCEMGDELAQADVFVDVDTYAKKGKPKNPGDAAPTFINFAFFPSE